MTLAIDFGTSNTVVAHWNPATETAETLSLRDLSARQTGNPPLVPSLVYVEDAAAGRIVAGQAVRDRGLDVQADPRFFRSFKRGIGTGVKGFLPELDGRSVDFERVGEWFLGAIAETLTAGKYLQADSNLVLTVPVDSFEAYRHWLGRAVETSALGAVQQVRLLDEPTAAALGYGLGDRELVLVVDFGGGTLDLSLVKLDRRGGSKPLGFLLKWAGGAAKDSAKSAQTVKTARVLAKAGLNLGGADLDHWLADRFAESHNLPTNPTTLRLLERLKIELSVAPQASEVYFDDRTFDSLELALSREEFESLLRDRFFFGQLDEAMTQVLQQARRQGIEAGDIDAVLMVGGTCQIPAVRQWVLRYFDADRVALDRPFEAIATGALQLARGIQVKDFLYHAYGVRYWNHRERRHGWHEIVPKGQPYPTAEPVELVLGASTENQPSIELIVGEMGETAGGTEIYFDGDRLVTRQASGDRAAVQPLNDRDGARNIARLDPPGSPGSDRVRVLFAVDAQRTLRITVDDLLVDRRLLDDCPVVQLS